MFNKLKENFTDWKNIYLQMKLDKANLEQFKKVIQDEYNDRRSQFNNFNLRADNDFSEIGYVIDIPEEFQTKGQEWQIMDKLNENSFFITEYLKKKLGFEDYVSFPEYYHIEDPSDDSSTLSCSYLATWKFIPGVDEETKKKFRNLVVKVVSSSVIAIGGIVTAIILI